MRSRGDAYDLPGRANLFGGCHRGRRNGRRLSATRGSGIAGDQAGQTRDHRGEENQQTQGGPIRSSVEPVT